MARLTPQQKLFCNEYIIDLNAKQAAIRAGYSERTAQEQGSRLLSNVKVQEYISKRMASREKRTEITQDFVLRELVEIASVNATDYARVVEKQATVTVKGEVIELYDADGNPVMYRTVEPLLTEELTEVQKKALSVIKKGRDGFEIKPYSKIEALKLIGAHLGMWNKKGELDIEEQKARIEKIKAETARLKGEDKDSMQDDGFLEALRGEIEDTWQD